MASYENYSELPYFYSGHIIVEDALFEVERGIIKNDWDLTGKTVGEKVEESRKVADLSNRKRIVYDDEHVFNPDVVRGEGELITGEDLFNRLSPEEQDDYESYGEYWANH